MSPLAKKHRSKEGLVERFEAICNGKEICNAFFRTNDPIDQRKTFLKHSWKLGKRGDPEAMMLDEDFLRAIEFGHASDSRSWYRYRQADYDYDQCQFLFRKFYSSHKCDLKKRLLLIMTMNLLKLVYRRNG